MLWVRTCYMDQRLFSFCDVGYSERWRKHSLLVYRVNTATNPELIYIMLQDAEFVEVIPQQRTDDKRTVTNTATQIKRDKLLKKMHNVFYLDVSPLGGSRFNCKGCSSLFVSLSSLLCECLVQFVPLLIAFASHTHTLC